MREGGIMTKEEEVFIKVSEEAMSIRNYNPSLSVVASQAGYIKNTYRIIRKTEYKSLLRTKLKLSRYKVDKLIQVYIDLNLISEEGEYYKFNPIQKSFIKLTLPTALYFLDNLSDYVFKVYCWFLNKYEIHLKKYYNGDNFFFSITQVIEGIGYSKTSTSWSRMMEALNTLEQLGYISYNHEKVGRPGHHGLYHELYWVKKYGKAQIKATEDLIEQYAEEITEDMVPRLVAGNKEQLKQIEQHNKLELSTEEKAQKVKEGLEKGFPMTAFLPEYVEAYKQNENE